MSLRSLRVSRRSVYAWLTSVAVVAVVTGAIELLKGHVPVLSLAVLYLLAVLPVAIVWGMGYAVAVSIASMAELTAPSESLAGVRATNHGRLT